MNLSSSLGRCFSTHLGRSFWMNGLIFIHLSGTTQFQNLHSSLRDNSPRIIPQEWRKPLLRTTLICFFPISLPSPPPSSPSHLLPPPYSFPPHTFPLPDDASIFAAEIVRTLHFPDPPTYLYAPCLRFSTSFKPTFPPGGHELIFFCSLVPDDILTMF